MKQDWGNTGKPSSWSAALGQLGQQYCNHCLPSSPLAWLCVLEPFFQYSLYILYCTWYWSCFGPLQTLRRQYCPPQKTMASVISTNAKNFPLRLSLSTFKYQNPLTAIGILTMVHWEQRRKSSDTNIEPQGLHMEVRMDKWVSKTWDMAVIIL